MLISKPPSLQVAEELLGIARSSGKPVVVNLIGYHGRPVLGENLFLGKTLDEAAEIAVKLATEIPDQRSIPDVDLKRFTRGQRYLRGLYSGGTLAYEALFILGQYLPEVYSNVPLDKAYRLSNSMISQTHTIVDLGEDEFTVGRLHPMMDNDLRIRRLRQEADDPETAVILLDIVLGYGAHPNPAGEMAPAIAKAQATAKEAGRNLEIVAVVVGTDEDPQDMAGQVQQLQDAGARVETSNETAVRYVGGVLQALNPFPAVFPVETTRQVELAALNQPMVAINVGLESFSESLLDQGAEVIQVDWRPPAGGNEKLMAILGRMNQ
jgi:FdrA protein